MGPLRRNEPWGLRSCSSGNGSGRTRPRRGCAGGSCAARPSGPASVVALVLALGKGPMQQDHLRRPPNSRTGQVLASVRPPAPRRPGRNRTVSPIRHNAPRSQGPRSGRSRSVAGRRSLPHPHGRGLRIWRWRLRLLGGGASSLEEPTVYSPSRKSLLRPYARCPMQQAMFLAFIAGADQSPNRPQLRISSCARMAIARVFRRGMAYGTNAPRKRPLQRAFAARQRE